MLQSFCDPGEARTLDPMIKSHLLYQLSYGVNSSSNSVAKVRRILKLTKSFAKKINFFQTENEKFYSKKQNLRRNDALLVAKCRHVGGCETGGLHNCIVIKSHCLHFLGYRY